jgi:hypothetical protein
MVSTQQVVGKYCVMMLRLDRIPASLTEDVILGFDSEGKISMAAVMQCSDRPFFSFRRLAPRFVGEAALDGLIRSLQTAAIGD